MDRTKDFNQLILSSTIKPKPHDRQHSSSDHLQKWTRNNIHDEFTKEAYRILEHINEFRKFLLSIRQAYLQTAPNRSQARSTNTLTGKERDEIDFEAKSIIRQTMTRIQVLETLEKERRQKNEKKGFLERMMRSKEEEALETLLSTHRGAINWYLSKKLTEASDIQRDQQETRLKREVEKSKSMVHVSEKRPTTLHQESKPSRAVREEEIFESTLSQEQLQMLEQENQSLLEGFQGTMEQIKGTEKTLLEISALQNELMVQLTSQASLTDRLYDDAIEMTESVEKGNKQLIRARKRHKSATRYILVFLLVMSLLLLLLDAWY